MLEMVIADELEILRWTGGQSVATDRDMQEAIDRAVRNGERLVKIEASTAAAVDLIQDVRKELFRTLDELRTHLGNDAQAFASVDSRFVGQQNQMTNILQTNDRIEEAIGRIEKNIASNTKLVGDTDAAVRRLQAEVFDEDGHSNIRALLDAEKGRRGLFAFLRSQWIILASGSTFTAAIIGAIVGIAKLLGL
jgi:uncharacterized protein YukE